MIHWGKSITVEPKNDEDIWEKKMFDFFVMKQRLWSREPCHLYYSIYLSPEKRTLSICSLNEKIIYWNIFSILIITLISIIETRLIFSLFTFK